jgi:hypothetical protein
VGKENCHLLRKAKSKKMRYNKGVSKTNMSPPEGASTPAEG